MTARTLRSADVLLLAAHPLELEPFAGALGAELRARIGSLAVVAADVGVGLAAAGGGAARRLAEHAPRAAVLVGSYGVYPGHGPLAPGRVLVPARVCAVDGSERAGKAAFPAPMPVVCEPDVTLSGALATGATPVERGAVATTLGITTDDALARDLAARSGCYGENLEALAIALACQGAGVAFAAVLGCTNTVGSQGRAQWLEHRTTAAHATAELVRDWLARGAPGRPPS
jgi:nucleoside phosphorylase